MSEESTALAVIEADYELRLGDVHLATHRDVLNKAAEASRELAGIIRDRKLFKRIGQKDHVYVEGWTTCGAMFGVAIRPVSCDENPAIEGEFVATVEAVRASDGFVLGRGIASCGPDEAEWKKRSRQARRSMAQTRAAGKAMRLLFSWVMEMAGYAPTPLEELDGSQAEIHDNPEPAPDAPQAAPRGKRQPAPTEVSEQQVAHVIGEWKARNPDPDGNLMRQGAAFKAWVLEKAGRTFNPRVVAEWKFSDYQATCEVLGIPRLEELA